MNAAASTSLSEQDQPRRFGRRFRATRVLRSGSAGETLRGIDAVDGREVVIRTVVTSDVDAPGRLEEEVAVLSRLEGTELVRSFACGRQGGVAYSVRPYEPGVTLEAHLAAGLPALSVPDALTVGRGVLAALAEAHEHGVLHRDVRPSNVVVRFEPGVDGRLAAATLVDFGVTRLLHAAGSPPETDLRAARCTSPEAAGLVAHEVDERSDLYSAGAVLFQCLAGRPAFGGQTVGDLLRQHLTQPVPALRSLGIVVPRALDQVVQRLLMKEPADRYASARAALDDLDAVAAALEAGDDDPHVLVGAHDPRRTLTQPAFVGRDAELAAIEAELDQAGDGHGGLVLVEAESGGGKTKLLEELAQRSAEHGVWVLRGQGVDQMAQRPLGVLDGVVDAVIRRAGTDRSFVETVRRALGAHAQFLVDALPALTPVFGRAESGSLGPEAYGEARSLPALTAFLDALAAPGAPVLVALDDCQWADELTLKLIDHWSSHAPGSGGRRIVLVAAFRSEEAPAGHLLRRLHPSVHVALPAFADEEMRRMLVSMAGPLPDEAVGVVERLSAGNPFMATAVLRGLVETGALVEEREGWAVDPEAMADVQTSRHAAAFLARRLDLFSPPARRLLSVGALLGKEFDSTLAAALAGQSTEEAETAVDEARRRHVLWTSGTRCLFVHDKLREALFAQLDEDDCRSLHHDAALAIEAQSPERVFDLAYHFDAAGDARRALPYALAAADRARRQHALEIAERHYRIAARGADRADDPARRRVAEGLGDVLMLRGEYDQAAAHLEVAAELAEDVVDKAEIEGKLGELAFKQGDVATASRVVEGAVRLLGRRMPKGDVGFLVSAVFEVVVQLLHTLAPRLFLARRKPDDARAELLAVRLYSRLAYVYWFKRGRVPCLWAHLREMNLAERYPASAELAQAYSEHAPVMTMVPWFSRGLAYAEKSLRIRTELSDVWGQGQSLHFIGVVQYASSLYQDCIDSCRRAAALLDRTGDCWEANTARWHIAFSLYRLGDMGAAVDAAALVHRAATAIGDHQARGIALSAWTKAAEGNVPAELLAGDLERVGEDVHTGAEVLQAEARRLLAAGRPAEAVAALERAARMVADKGLKQEYVAPVQPWLATALRLQAEGAALWSADRERVLRRARRAARRARRVARSYPNNRPHALRESAVLAAMAGRRRRARRWFDESLRVAEEQGARHEHAQSVLARGLVGVDLSWPGASDDVVQARRALAELASTTPDPTPDGGPVTLSLLDRFDSLLGVGQRIASALTPGAVYAAVRDATLLLLRAEDSAVLGLDVGDRRTTTLLAGNGGRAFNPGLVAKAVSTGRPVVLESEPDADVPAVVRSTLCAPIFNRGRAVACCYLTHAQVGGLFGEEEIRLAEFVTTLAGAALENAEGFAEVQALSRSLERRVEERTVELAHAIRQLTERSEAVALLKTIAVATNEAESVEAALQVAVDEVCRHTGWPVGHVCRTTADGGQTVPTTIWHLDDPERFATFRRITEATSFTTGQGLPGTVAATRAPAWVPDIALDGDFIRARTGERLEVRAGFAVPLLAGPQVVGALEFFSPDPQPVDRPLLDLVAQVGTELGRVVERKLAEDALRQSEERTRSILAAANDAFIGMDDNGRITDWNRSAELIFGWSRAEAIGRPLGDTIVPSGFRRAHDDGLRHFLETGNGPVLGKRIELTALHRDGHEFPVELSIWHSAAGHKHSFNAFVQDITERKRTEHALAVARDQAMEASRLKSQFLATMSHEIRTPMNGVIGLAELLLETDLRPEQRPYAEGLRSAGESLLAVINDILDFSKIEAGKLELEEVDFNPHDLVDEVVHLLAPAAHAKSLEIVGTCARDVPRVLRGDPGRVRQILVNLTSNAVKFTDQGEVVVRVRRAGEPIGDWVTVEMEVADTGIGIDTADQARILEPFSQADASTTRRFGGTGLGLAISRQLAEAMGGAMTLESRPAHGSTFRVTIPLGLQWNATPPAPRLSPLQGVKVLVADDNATARAAVESLLAASGAGTETAPDGSSALDLLRQAAQEDDPFDVAIVDAAMPGMDGFELAARMSLVHALRSTRVLLLTTGRPLDAATARQLGVDASISKPVVAAELEEALAGLLDAAPGRSPSTTDAPPPEVARATETTTRAAGRAHPAPRTGRGRILVVEDNTTNQMVATGLLARLGFDPEVVSDGRQAVDAIARNRYDAVLMDCNMPVMDGFEATRITRNREATGRHVPIVAMTASALVGDRERCLAAGMDDYVSKPVKLGDLDRVLSRWLPRSSPDSAPEGVDVAQLDSLRALDGGDGAFLSNLVESFLTSARQALPALADAAATGDLARLVQEAHRFKGEAANLGLTDVAELCGRLESLHAPFDWAVASKIVDKTARSFERSREALIAAVDAARVA